MKRLLCCIMALTMIGSATAFAAEPVDNSAIAEKALSEVTALYEDLYTITNAEAEVQNSTYDDMGNIIVDVVVSFDRTLKATCAEDMPYIQGLEIALTELTDPDEISAASAYIDAKKADLEDNYTERQNMPPSGAAPSRFGKSPDGAVRSTCGKNLHGFHKH